MKLILGLLLGNQVGALRSRLNLPHFAAAVENDAFINAEAGCQDIASKNSGFMDFNPVFSYDRPIDFAADDYGPCFDLSVNSGAFPNDQSVWRVNLPPEYPPNSESPLKAKLTFKFAPLLNHPCDLRRGRRSTKYDGTLLHLF